MIFCAVPVTSQWNVTVSSVTVGVIVSWISYYFLYVLNQTLSSVWPLYICTIWCALFESFPLFYIPPSKIRTPKILLPFIEKIIWNTLYVKQEKWTYQIYLDLLRGWQITKGLIGQWFKETSLVNKNIYLLKY